MMQLLRQQEEITVEEACERFDISAATARRSFLELAKVQGVEKFWGGIRLATSANHGLSPTRWRLDQEITAKKAIAEHAARMVKDGVIVFLDGGTTTYCMAPLLAERAVRIVTNSLLAAYEIDRLRRGSGGAEVFVTGGFLYPRSGQMVGPEAVAALKAYHADIAFISAGGLIEEGATNNHHLVVEMERGMIENAEKSVMVADPTKFGRREMIHECGWEELDTLVTTRVPEPWRERLPRKLRIQEAWADLPETALRH